MFGLLSPHDDFLLKAEVRIEMEVDRYGVDNGVGVGTSHLLAIIDSHCCVRGNTLLETLLGSYVLQAGRLLLG